MDTVPITLDKEIPYNDYIKLTSYCIPFPEGGMFKQTTEGKQFQLHKAHLRGANILFNRLGLPHIEIKQVVRGRIIVKPNEREKMKLTITVVEDGLLVIDKSSEHFVSFEDIEILWGILKQQQEILPRKVWATLAGQHNLFPELDAIVGFIKENQELNPVLKDSWITALHEYKASVFEGMRTKKKGKEENTYYVLYWFGILFLKQTGLIGQAGAKEIFLTEKGRQTKDWKDVLIVSEED